jgi:chaperonin GroES
MNIRPLSDRILVKRVEKDNVSKGGIIIPDTAKEKPMEATVVAVGNGKVMDNGETRPVAVSVGDTVLFSKYAGTEVKIEGDEHLILREDDIIGILEG